MVSGLTLQLYGQLLRIVWKAPIVNCNTISNYTVAMKTYTEGTLIEMGATTVPNYTLTKNYSKCFVCRKVRTIYLLSPSAAGVPYIATVWAIFGTMIGENSTLILFSQELGMQKYLLTSAYKIKHISNGSIPSLHISSQWYPGHCGHLNKCKHHPSEMEASVSS